MAELTQRLEQAGQKIEKLREEIGRVIVGQKRLVDRLIIALLSNGHVLLEGVPGVAKTMAATTLAKALQLDCKRIQFTPDLLPSDLIGTSVFNPKESSFFVQKGPVFTNIVIADEINRAPPKVQAALLEVMQEKQVTIAGESLTTGNPFLVVATQNPIEHEGTYPLPEAQTDRFMMKVKVGYPSKEEEKEVVARFCRKEKLPAVTKVMGAEEIRELQALANEIYIDEKVLNYIVEIIFATRFSKESGADLNGWVDFGGSPRATIALVMASKAHALLQGREYVTPFDVKEVGFDVLRHRLMLSYEAEAEEISVDDVLERIFASVKVP